MLPGDPCEEHRTRPAAGQGGRFQVYASGAWKSLKSWHPQCFCLNVFNPFSGILSMMCLVQVSCPRSWTHYPDEKDIHEKLDIDEARTIMTVFETQGEYVYYILNLVQSATDTLHRWGWEGLRFTSVAQTLWCWELPTRSLGRRWRPVEPSQQNPCMVNINKKKYNI